MVGGGIGGMAAALEAAECGKQVILAERAHTLGGRTARLYRYFPQMCHPTCGLEINLRRLKASRNVRVLTLPRMQSDHERQLAGVPARCHGIGPRRGRRLPQPADDSGFAIRKTKRPPAGAGGRFPLRNDAQAAADSACAAPGWPAIRLICASWTIPRPLRTSTASKPTSRR